VGVVLPQFPLDKPDYACEVGEVGVVQQVRQIERQVYLSPSVCAKRRRKLAERHKVS